MACPAVLTGDHFLEMALRHVDCQAQTIGAFGYAALAQPGSPVSIALTGLLTLFVALFGLRLMLGYPMGGRDLVGDILKIGIVLTLATSWPAWRVMGYDLVVQGPAEIARAIGLAAQLPGPDSDIAARLQRIDDGLAALVASGSGRPQVVQGDWFHTQNDWYQLGLSRIVFLSGTLGVTALVRLTAGILLAIAPLMAGLLLFDVSRPIFVGWARGLAMTFLASIALTLIIGIEVTVMEPWLQDALLRRVAQQQILDAPVEALAIALTFALVAFGSVLVALWIAFHPSGLLSFPTGAVSGARDQATGQARMSMTPAVAHSTPDGARHVAQSVGASLRREARHIEMRDAATGSTSAPGLAAASPPPPVLAASGALGSSYRRNSRRASSAGQRRDDAR